MLVECSLVTDTTLIRISENAVVAPVLAEALGRAPLDEPIEPGSGGPAGNGRLTAILGALLVVGMSAQLLTVIDVRGLISWHFGIGVALVALVVAKVGSTGYKMVRYYTGSPAYRRLGPPPLVLRLIGPVLVITAAVALWSGINLALVGSDAGRQSLVTVLGHRIDWVSIHQVATWTWVAVVAVHLLTRFVPMVRRLRRPNVPGVVWRGVAIVLTLAAAVLAARWGLDHIGQWGQGGFGGPPRP